MNELILAPLAVGTIAFFVTVYLSIQHPELVDSPGEEKPRSSEHPLRKWDTVITWIMWGGWGIAGVMTFLEKGGFL